MKQFISILVIAYMLLLITPEIKALNLYQQQTQVFQQNEKSKILTAIASKWSPTQTPTPSPTFDTKSTATPSATPSSTPTPTVKGG